MKPYILQTSLKIPSTLFIESVPMTSVLKHDLDLLLYILVVCFVYLSMFLDNLSAKHFILL